MFLQCFGRSAGKVEAAAVKDAPESPVSSDSPACSGKIPAEPEPNDTSQAAAQRLGSVFREEEGISEDYHYDPTPGDIDHPASFGYKVYYKMVSGLTFEMCQKGAMTPEVKVNFIKAIKELEALQVCAITGDCGFMFWFQDTVREYTTKPVLLSSLVQLPSITCSLGHQQQVAIFTANGGSLKPMMDKIEKACGVAVNDNRFLIVGCEHVEGFEAVANGDKVDTVTVQPGIVQLAKEIIAQNPNIKALLLECTELPPYADALRYALGLPVYDAITCCDSFVDGYMDNPRFGLDGWMQTHHGNEQNYKLNLKMNANNEVCCAACNTKIVHKL